MHEYNPFMASSNEAKAILPVKRIIKRGDHGRWLFCLGNSRYDRGDRVAGNICRDNACNGCLVYPRIERKEVEMSVVPPAVV
jgi:hypothetical protein